MGELGTGPVPSPLCASISSINERMGQNLPWVFYCGLVQTTRRAEKGGSGRKTWLGSPKGSLLDRTLWLGEDLRAVSPRSHLQRVSSVEQCKKPQSDPKDPAFVATPCVAK